MYSKYRAISELKWKDLPVYENWEHRYLKSIISHLLENMDGTFQSLWYLLFSYNSLSSWHQFLSIILLHFQLLKVSEDLQYQTPLRRLVAGGLAGTTSVIATYPLDLVR